jgi:hypothetical protein
VIWRTAVWPGTQKTQQHDPLDTRVSRCLDYVLCALDMNAFVRLPAELTVDAGAVRNGLAAAEQFAQ